MLPYLDSKMPLPSASHALRDPNGLVAVGADLSTRRLIEAYQKGIFPWYSEGEPILWWSPDPRTVFDLAQFSVHKSVIKTLKKLGLKVTLNRDFEQVIRQCAKPRSASNGVWITEAMVQAYCALHRKGFAHSVEVWQNQQLVGGIYGVATGRIFCGESMFSAIPNGSKIALSCLCNLLKNKDYLLLDCQLENPHLVSLGAINISRSNYLDYLKLHHPSPLASIQPQVLDWPSLLGVSHRKGQNQNV